MHGVVHQELERFVVGTSGESVWQRVVTGAALADREYLPTERYDDAELTRLVLGAASETGCGPQQFLEMFGAAIAPTLIGAYGHLIPPAWRTLELILNTEAIVHTALRASDPAARPPLLNASRRGANEVAVIYASERRMCGFAKGIARGVATHYGESLEITDEACMLWGDPTCRLAICRVASR